MVHGVSASLPYVHSSNAVHWLQVCMEPCAVAIGSCAGRGDELSKLARNSMRLDPVSLSTSTAIRRVSLTALGAGCGHSGAGGAGQCAAGSGLKRALLSLRDTQTERQRAERRGGEPRRRPRRWRSPWARDLGGPWADSQLSLCFALETRLQRGSRRCSHSSCLRGPRPRPVCKPPSERCLMPLQDLPSAAPPYGLSSPNPMPTTLSSVHPQPPRLSQVNMVNVAMSANASGCGSCRLLWQHLASKDANLRAAADLSWPE